MSRPRRSRRLIGTAGAAVVVGAAVIVWWGDGWSLPEFEVGALGWDRLDRVEVSGAVRLSPDQVRAWADVPMGTGLWSLDPDLIVSRVAGRPWIRTVAIRKRFPGTLLIDVVERVPAAVARMERGWVLVDEEGRVIERTLLDRGFPRIVGASEKRPEGLAAAASVLEGFRAADPAFLRGEDLVVDVAAPRDPIVTLPNGSRVRFGEGDYADKWRRYVAVHADVAQRLPGDRIVDLRFPGRAVVASAGGG